MRTRLLLLPLLAALIGACETTPIDPGVGGQRGPAARPAPQSGILLAGAAQSLLELPVGVPLAAFTGRLDLLNPEPDRRTSPYATEFAPSAGVQTRVPIKVIWLQNGDTNVVLVKIDIAYAFDGLLFGIQEAIADATGYDVIDHVLVATSHSHSSYGDFSNDAALYLGSDQFNTEVYTRIVDQVVAVAEQAAANLEPASIGVGFDPEFDPDDQIYRDRREENDDLIGPDGEVLGHGYKEERLTVVRIDRSQGTETPDDDEPLALIHSFPMHGTIMGESNSLVSIEGTGHITRRLQQTFGPDVVVMHLQGPAGDASPAGYQDDFARMEVLAELAAPRILALYDAIPTASGNISVELLTRSIHQYRDEMHITRGGTVDYYYTPYTPRYRGDDIVYGEDGKVLSPIDEFNSENGAALCDGDPSLVILGKVFGWGSEVPPYNTCANVDPILKLMDLPLFDFDLSWTTLPLKSALSTVISTIKLSQVPVHVAGGEEEVADVVFGVFPGEPTSLYGATYKKEMLDAYGYRYVVPLGYAQDHEGYLLTLEDWLAGGYEAEINQWGPIQGEYILEQVVALGSQFGIDDPSMPPTAIPHPDQEADYFPFDPVVPDVTMDAGETLSRVPSYLYTYNDVMPTSPQPAAKIPRVTGIATFVWKGGDPAVDLPVVTLERETTPGSNVFEPVLEPNGEPLTDAGPDILLSYTPDPLRSDGPQTHYWMATFQAVTHNPTVDYSAGLPLGRYRFRVDGVAVMSNDVGAYPWNTSPYRVVSQVFEVTRQTEIQVSASYSGGTLQVEAAYPPADQGYRLISMDSGNEKGPSPLCRGPYSEATGTIYVYDEDWLLLWQKNGVTFTTNWGSSSTSIATAALGPGTYHLVVEDVFGNSGATDLSVTD